MTRPAFLLPVLVVALALGLDFLFLGGKTLWNDEAVSFYAGLDGIGSVLEWTAQDVHPPLYYLALSAWMRLGDGEAALRALSAFSMAGAALFTFLAARRLIGPGPGFVAALLFLSNPTTVSWAQKARPYGLQTLLLSIALWGFVAGWLTLRDQRRRWFAGTGGLATDLACLAYVLGGGLGMLAQHQGGFFVLGCNLAMLAVLVRLWRDGDGVAAFRLLGSWVVAQILLIAIWACWLPWFIAQYHDHLTASGLHGHGNYMVDGAQLRDIVIGLLGTAYVWRLKLALFALFMAVAIPSCLMLARQRSDKRLVLVLFTAPLAVCLAGFAFVHPVFGYVIGTFPWLLMPYCMVLASGIAALPWRPAGAAVLGVLLAANVLGLRNYYATPHQPLDQAAAFIAADARAGDGFMVSTTDATRKGIGYYLRRGGKDGLIDVSVFGPAMARDLDAALSHQRVWLILPLEEEPAVSLDVLRQRFTLAAETRFGDLRVFRFDQTTR